MAFKTLDVETIRSCGLSKMRYFCAGHLKCPAARRKKRRGRHVSKNLIFADCGCGLLKALLPAAKPTGLVEADSSFFFLSNKVKKGPKLAKTVQPNMKFEA